MTSPYPTKFSSQADPRAVITCGNARFSLLKSRLIRMEYDPAGQFTDQASQVFWHRSQPVPPFSQTCEGGWLTVETDDLILRYKIGGEFHWRDLQIELRADGSVWRYGDADFLNLRGTARTLDRANGRIPLEPGLISRSGWSVIDDSKTLLFDDDGWLQPRNSAEGAQDLYFLGYGQDYLAAIREYQDISGRPGLIPRWALGNWWSRYWAYTQKELLDLMQEFSEKSIPLSVCIVDMDWHITQTGNTSSGWTGYTWNRQLFPDPQGFIQALHAQNLKTALNLHPAEGVHPHEEQYPAFAQALGLDENSQQPIPFDIASKNFTRAYFDLLHHPYEQKGIDFWWLDWQQGTQTRVAGLDPLFWLNHLHYFDLGRQPDRRPFIFSRWPGLGGQRYPIGFSGDTIVSWETLTFQPEFTATASNVAFGWWSHDIGGHCEGIEEAELYLRWVQFGVFSPILRLHSTNNPYCDRRPWAFGEDILEATRRAMRLRHQLIPMIYTAAHKNSSDGEPVILPMYYAWPKEEAAYQSPQQYLFCQQLLVAPFTHPADPETRLSRQVVWLPSGDWYNFFSGEYYAGDCWTSCYGNLNDIPVFAPAGAIIPLAEETGLNGVSLPEVLRLRVFAGANNEFTLYEDDGESQSYLAGEKAETTFSLQHTDSSLRLGKAPTQGDPAVLPAQRQFIVELLGLAAYSAVLVQVDGLPTEVDTQFESATGKLTVGPFTCGHTQSFEVSVKDAAIKREPGTQIQRLEKIIQAARMPTLVKQIFWQRLPGMTENPAAFFEIAHYFSESQQLAIFEAFFPALPAPISADLTVAAANMRRLFAQMIRR